LGANAGRGVTGNSNIAIGENAGSNSNLNAAPTLNTAAPSALAAATADPAALAATNATDAANGPVFSAPPVRVLEAQSATPAVANGADLTGNQNIAIGYNAGQGTGQAFSNSITIGASAAAPVSNGIAIGTAADAAGTGSVAFGTNASAPSANSVALGTGSVADEANSVSVGSTGAERQIIHVAPGVNPTDAVNVSQLNGVEQNVLAVDAHADRGVAMALAQIDTVGPNPTPGRATVGVGTGYFGGATAFGMAVASSNAGGDRTFSFGASMSPGAGDIGLHTGLRFAVGPHTKEAAVSAPASAPASAAPAIVPGDSGALHRRGVDSVTQVSQNLEYFVRAHDRAYRIMVTKNVLATTNDDAWQLWLERIPAGNAAPAYICQGTVTASSSSALLQRAITLISYDSGS
jgi:hypothetical protein